MSEHYFSNKPQSKSNPKTWLFELRGHIFHFTSDSGVFSKNEVDYGSRTLIETFVPPEITGDLLDLGCGYGPIGLAIAKAFSDRHVMMSDINERALVLAKENAERNKISNVSFYHSDRFTNITQDHFAAILVNPPIRAGKQTVHQMFSDSYKRLTVGGELWVVIQKKQGAPSALKKLNEYFGEVEVTTRQKGYYIIRAKK